MPDFRFALGHHAKVPHFMNVQGVVHGFSDHIKDGKRYLMAWLSGSQVVCDWFTADEMAKANAPAVIETPAADTLGAGSESIIVDFQSKPAAIVKRIRNRKGKPARKKR